MNLMKIYNEYNLREAIRKQIKKTKGSRLDLGCGANKLENSFGVNFSKTNCTDLVWNLEQVLPVNFSGKYSLVYSLCVLDHIGNPLRFLERCVLYAKPGGFVQVIVDNASYWRYHKLGSPFGNYHSLLWLKETSNPLLRHKMMFQAGHIKTLFELVGLEFVESNLFWRESIDYLFPKHLGTAFISIIGKKPKEAKKK